MYLPHLKEASDSINVYIGGTLKGSPINPNLLDTGPSTPLPRILGVEVGVFKVCYCKELSHFVCFFYSFFLGGGLFKVFLL